MKQNAFGLIRWKLKAARAKARKYYFQMLGMSVSKGTFLGKITCEWPQKVIIGADTIIQDGVDFRIAHPFSSENYIKIGKKVFVGRYCEFNSASKIIVGDNAKIASKTTIVDISHHVQKATAINTQEVISEEIIIGEDVWIGTGSIILKGVIIGKGSVVGAGSLINKSIPEYQIWAGYPAKFIKDRV